MPDRLDAYTNLEILLSLALGVFIIILVFARSWYVTIYKSKKENSRVSHISFPVTVAGLFSVAPLLIIYVCQDYFSYSFNPLISLVSIELAFIGSLLGAIGSFWAVFHYRKDWGLGFMTIFLIVMGLVFLIFLISLILTAYK